MQSGFTPLHLAASKDRRKTAQMLVSSGADLDIQDNVSQ